MKTVEVNFWDLHQQFGNSEVEELAVRIIEDINCNNVDIEDMYDIIDIVNNSTDYQKHEFACMQYYKTKNDGVAFDRFCEDIATYCNNHI